MVEALSIKAKNRTPITLGNNTLNIFQPTKNKSDKITRYLKMMEPTSNKNEFH